MSSSCFERVLRSREQLSFPLWVPFIYAASCLQTLLSTTRQIKGKEQVWRLFYGLGQEVACVSSAPMPPEKTEAWGHSYPLGGWEMMFSFVPMKERTNITEQLDDAPRRTILGDGAMP